MASITIDTVTLHTGQHAGAGYFAKSLEQWFDLPDSKAEGQSIPGGHGDFDGGEDWSEAALFSIPGWLRGNTRAEALRMKAELNKVRRTSGLCLVTVDDGADVTTREASIRRIKYADMRYQRRVDFLIDFRAYDPFRYGPALITSTGLPTAGTGYVWPAVWPADWGSGGDPGRLVTYNGGTQPTYTKFSIAGGSIAGGVSIRNIDDGREIRLERDLPAGSTVYFDQTTGRVYLDTPENDISGSLTRSEWWQVPSLESRTIQFAALGSVTGTPILTAATPPPYL